MAHKLADLRAKHKAFKDEADGIFATAESDTGGELTAAQEQRLTAIKGELVKLDGEIDAEIAALAPPADPNPATDPNAAAQAEANERKRSSEIIAACKLAGKLDKAAAFVAEGKSLSEVVGLLQGERATESDKNATQPGNTGRHAGVDVKAGWEKAVAKQNKRNGFN